MEQINQYDIVWVDLAPTLGSEMRKTRPCVILSPNEMNRHLNTVVIAPMTSRSKSYPTRIEVKRQNTKSWVAIDQIRTIDRMRIIKHFGALTEKEIQLVKDIIREAFVD